MLGGFLTACGAVATGANSSTSLATSLSESTSIAIATPTIATPTVAAGSDAEAGDGGQPDASADDAAPVEAGVPTDATGEGADTSDASCPAGQHLCANCTAVCVDNDASCPTVCTR